MTYNEALHEIDRAYEVLFPPDNAEMQNFTDLTQWLTDHLITEKEYARLCAYNRARYKEEARI